MRDKSRTNTEPIEEISVLKQRIQGLEQAESERKRAEEEIAVLAEIGRVIGFSLDINEVYEKFAAEARKLIPFDRITVNLCNIRENVVTVAYVYGAELSNRKKGDSLPLTGTLIEEVLRKRTGQIIQSEKMDEIVRRIPAFSRTFQSGLRSLIGIPLIYKDETIGTLQFRSKTPNAYTERDLHLAERIGAQIAGAIANAQLYLECKQAEEALQRAHDNLEQRVADRTEELMLVNKELRTEITERKRVEEEQRSNREITERLAEEMAVIAKIGRVINSSLNIEEIYESFAAQAKKLVPFDRLSVDLNNPDEATFTITYFSGFDIPGRRPGDTVPIAGTISEAVLLSRTGLFINVANTEGLTGRFPHLTSTPTIRAGMLSLISVPLISRNEVFGTLHFRSKKVNAYTEQDLRLAEKIGAQIAGAIANAQLYSGLRQAEGALQKSEQQLKSLIEGAGDAIYVLKTDTGRILNCNSRACLDLGYSKDELVKLSATDIESRLSSGEIDSIHHDLKPGEVKQLEGMHKRKDGSVFPVEIRFSLLSPAQPELVISIVRDITERKRTEEELERHRIHLEAIVKERTAELEIKNITLQELNTTLKVLLKQREDDKKDTEERFVMNIRNLVLPFVEQMKKGRLDVGQQPCLEIIETHLHDIATPLLKNMRQFNLTPKELKVAALVRNGISTKGIAEILSIATGSVDIHRNNIRKKLGLNDRRTNLQSHLETLG